MRWDLLIVSAALLVSCNNSSRDAGEQTNVADTITKKKKEDVAGCYLQVVGRDSIKLHLNESGENVSGTMAFKNYQKDSSSGTVEGYEEDDKVIVWYSFDSEGMHSIMQLVFQQTSEGLIRGVGDMINRGDTVLFRSMEDLKFSQKDLLRKTACP